MTTTTTATTSQRQDNYFSFWSYKNELLLITKGRLREGI